MRCCLLAQWSVVSQPLLGELTGLVVPPPKGEVL
jgi:hypothetical protein